MVIPFTNTPEGYCILYANNGETTVSYTPTTMRLSYPIHPNPSGSVYSNILTTKAVHEI